MRMKSSRKVATNLSVDSQLISRAKPLGINLSQVFEQALERAIAQREREAWLEENQEAIGEFNERVTKRGVFSDDWRKF
jgi:antitoxin CcdA